MSRRPRGRALRVGRDADWSAVSETVDDDGLVYRVLWSADLWMYLGVCDTYPEMSWQAATEEDALTGIRRQVRRRADPSPPPAGGSRGCASEG